MFAFTGLLQSASHRKINLIFVSPSVICSSRFKALQIFGSVSPEQVLSPIPLCTAKIFLELCFPSKLIENIQMFKVLQKHIIWNCIIAEVDKSDEVLPIIKHTMQTEINLNLSCISAFIFIYVVKRTADEYFLTFFSINTDKVKYYGEQMIHPRNSKSAIITLWTSIQNSDFCLVVS